MNKEIRVFQKKEQFSPKYHRFRKLLEDRLRVQRESETELERQRLDHGQTYRFS